MPKPVESVNFNDGATKDVFSLVAKDVGETKLDLISFDPETGAATYHRGVPHREPADYGPEGGGYTWHN